MVIIKENTQLNEMAFSTINSPRDNLPFDVVVRSPDHNPPHAHLYPKGVRQENKQLGEFLIPKRPPKYAGDIEGYRDGVTDDQKERLAVWMSQRNKWHPKCTNWELLNVQFGFALNQ